MEYRQADDAQLMSALARGETAALGELVFRYQDGALALARRTLARTDGAEDVVQEAYLRVYRSAGRYRPTARFTTWLYRIVVNLCYDRLRGNKRQAAPLDETIAADTAAAAPDVLHAEDVARRVRSAVDALPDRQRTALTLHRYHGLSHSDISEATGWSVSAVESLLVRAYQRLRKDLADLK